MAASPENIRHRAEELAAGLPQLMVATERIAATAAPGTHGRRRVGQGDAFWQYRRYQQGDSAGQIDWRKSAKSQPLYVRETEWEAAQSVWLWRDASASMRYRSDKSIPEKQERADLLLMALAILLVRGGENVGMLGADRVPSHGPGTLDRITRALARATAPEKTPGIVQETAQGVVRRIATPRRRDQSADDSLPAFQLLARYGQTVLFGDFLGPLDETEARFRRFAARSVTGHMVQILDPAEETLPFTGRARFEGLEAEGSVLVRRVERTRAEYLNRLEAQREGLRRIARSLGWTYTSHRTDKPPQTALLALYANLSSLIAG